jgi:holo-[acyl-carrier protein] synthase
MGGRVGVDLVPYGRIRTMIGTESQALPYMLSAEEMALSTTELGPDIAGIAGRLAAKEAVFKLLRVAGETVPWSTTEILRAAGGWPEVRLSGRAAVLAANNGIDDISVSITHDDEYAIAVAFTTPSGQPTGGCHDEFCDRKRGRGSGLDPAQASGARGDRA